ncbi:MAG: acyltransferase [Oribacterium sp.]|nr:acyltransferase [Oribacterium sp.]MBP3803542.1 acyltransferase [Oribacterium sp.]
MSTGDSGSKRLVTLDIAKGIMILMVILIHVFLFNEKLIEAMSIILGNILLPLFFWASGYTYRTGRGFRANVKKRIPYLLKVYFFYSFGILLVGSALFLALGIPVRDIRNQILTHFLGEPLLNLIVPELINTGWLWSMVAPLWFLIQMMLGSIILYAIAEKALENNSNFILISAFLIATGTCLTAFVPQLPFNLQSTPVIAFFMLSGAFSGQHRWLHKYEEWSIGRLIASVVLFSVLQLSVADVYHGGNALSKGYFTTDEATRVISIYATLLSFVFGMMAFLGFSVLVGKIKGVSAVFSWIGRNSLSFYIIHMPVALLLAFFTASIPGQRSSEELLIIYIGLYFITVLICALWGAMENKIKSILTEKKRP